MSVNRRFDLCVEAIMLDVAYAMTEKYNLPLDKALDFFVETRTFEGLLDPETGLYYESGGCVFDTFVKWDPDYGKFVELVNSENKLIPIKNVEITSSVQ